MAELFSAEQVLFAQNVHTKTADAIKRTANRRIEAEMALIRLCSPETDTDVSALTARIARLEKELASLRENGVPVSAVAPVSAASVSAPRETASAVPGTPQRAPAIDPDEDIPPFEGFGQEASKGGYANAFSDEEEDDEKFDYDAFMAEYDKQTGAVPPEPAAPEPETPAAAEAFPETAPEPETAAAAEAFPKTAPEPAPAPEEKKHTYSPTVDGVLPDGPVNKGAWVNVVQETERSFSPLRGMLTGSTARIIGDLLVVTLARQVFLSDSLIIEKMLPVVERNLHRRYDIRLEK